MDDASVYGVQAAFTRARAILGKVERRGISASLYLSRLAGCPIAVRDFEEAVDLLGRVYTERQICDDAGVNFSIQRTLRHHWSRRQKR